MNIAIIDSGIDHRHINKKSRIVDIDLFHKKGYKKDVIGHGTMCASIITGMMPDVILYSINVMNNSFSTTPNMLLNAIEWCIDHNMDLINMSLGCSDISLYYEFQKLCVLAVSKGCTIVAAACNDGKISLPAYLCQTIGVGVTQKECQEIIYDPHSDISFYTSMNTSFGNYSTSFATAKITGLLAEHFNGKQISFQLAFDYLKCVSKLNDGSVPLKSYAPFNFRTNVIFDLKNLKEPGSEVTGGKVLFNTSVEKVLILNITSCDNTDLVLKIRKHLDGKQKKCCYFSPQKIVSSLDIQIIPKVESVTDFNYWLSATVNNYSFMDYEKFFISWNLKLRSVDDFIIDMDTRNALLLLVSLYLSFYPDKIYIVYDHEDQFALASELVDIIKNIDKEVFVKFVQNTNDKECLQNFLSDIEN